MVHYYCFIENPCNLRAGSRVFKVKVGECQRDQVNRVQVDCFATDTNAFFRLWDEDTVYFLANQLRTKPSDQMNLNFLKNLSARRATHVPPVKRQNLSVRPTREDTIAAVGFALMALLYWLGSLVGCWENAVL